MKPTTILSLTSITATTTATANPSIHAVADLIARAMDPTTMDPTKLSVLSVLKTAIPTSTGTGTDIVLPTGNVAPQWYKDLPADVMVLLAQMYPTTPTGAAAVSETAALASNATSSSAQDVPTASQTTLTQTLELVPTAAANGTVAEAGSLSGNATNETLATAAPSPNQRGTSTGAKNTVSTGMWSVAIGLGVAAAFCFFA